MQIRLATLNAWGIPEPIGRDVQERIDAIGKHLSSLDLDVMAFQEVWTREAALRLRDAGRAAGLPHCWFGDETFGAGGLLVLSRLPIEKVRFEPYAVTGAPERVVRNLEYVAGKGFATIQVTTPSGPLVVVDTHLHARYGSIAAHKHAAQRTGQVVQMTSRFIDSPLPMAVVGDFNFQEGEADYRVLTDILGLRDVAADLDRRVPTTLRSNPYGHRSFDRRKDFVFVRDGRGVRVTPRSLVRAFDETLHFDGRPAAYSNHAGLLVQLEVGAAETTAWSHSYPDAGVFDLAASKLAEGERLARARQNGGRRISGIGIGVSTVAALAAAPRRMSRRKMLRASLASAALLGLPPGIGYSVVSEVLVPDEIRAFRRAADQLAHLRSEAEGESLAS